MRTSKQYDIWCSILVFTTAKWYSGIRARCITRDFTAFRSWQVLLHHYAASILSRRTDRKSKAWRTCIVLNNNLEETAQRKYHLNSPKIMRAGIVHLMPSTFRVRIVGYRGNPAYRKHMFQKSSSSRNHYITVYANDPQRLVVGIYTVCYARWSECHDLLLFAGSKKPALWLRRVFAENNATDKIIFKKS